MPAHYTKKGWDEARKIAGQVNPRYWPVPTRQVKVPNGKLALAIETRAYLTEADAAPAWGYLSSLLQAHNPFKDISAPEDTKRRVAEILEKTMILLAHHTLYLSHPDFVINAGMRMKPDRDVHVDLFKRTVKAGSKQESWDVVRARYDDEI